MITEMEYETTTEFVFLDNAEFVKEQMEILGWQCMREASTEPATGRVRLEFRRTKPTDRAIGADD